MAISSFDFEKPILDLEGGDQGARGERIARPGAGPASPELQARLERTRREIYENLTPWQRVQMSRHIARPHALEYIKRLLTDWTELHGDRNFGDDHACLTGLASFGDRPVAVIAQQKGADVAKTSTAITAA